MPAKGGEEVLLNEDVFKTGGRKTQVPAHLRNRLSGGRTVSGGSGGSTRKKPLGVGDTVEAKYRGRIKWYKGTIEEVSGCVP